MKIKPMPELLTLDEASKVLRMSKSKLRHDEKAGRLKFLRFGRVVRLDSREIERYIESAAAGEREFSSEEME